MLQAWLDPGVQTPSLRAGLFLLLWHPLLSGELSLDAGKIAAVAVAGSHPHRAAAPTEENLSSFSGNTLELSVID